MAFGPSGLVSHFQLSCFGEDSEMACHVASSRLHYGQVSSTSLVSPCCVAPPVLHVCPREDVLVSPERLWLLRSSLLVSPPS